MIMHILLDWQIVWKEMWDMRRPENLMKNILCQKVRILRKNINFDTDTIKTIRKECRCNDGKSIAGKLLKYLNKADSIKGFVDLFNQNETFAFLEYISDNKILFCYPECYCACVKRVPQELSETWCYCTLGNAEGIFSKVFKKDVKVTLLKSIKTGADQCVIEVEW